MWHTLEELAQRFDELELHILQQSTDVVMRLNRRAWALETDTLNHVGVQRALQQPLNLALCRGPLFLLLFLRCGFELRRFGLEDIDEGVTDDLALLLGIFNALQER